MPIALVALALGGFGIGLTEFVIAGLLPEVAADFGVTEQVAGYLISGYALAVAIGAIALTVAMSRVNRKLVLVLLMVLFLVGNAMSALAPTYDVMLAGRIVAALCHGAFFGIGSVVAASLVPAHRQAAAISMMFGGLTIANVLGVPLGTFLGQAAGWRSTFWAITVIGVVALIGILALIPAAAVKAPSATGSILGEFRIFRSGQVWASILLTILGYGGMFGAFTYIAFTLTGVSGFAPAVVPWLLVLFGVGLFLGNVVGGRAADKNVGATLLVTLAGLVLVLAGFAAVATSQIATVVALVLMGVFGFATVPALQIRIMRHAASAQALGSGANIAAFNVGNAFGAWIGGITIAAGLGYTSPLWAGALVTLAGLGVLLVAGFAPGGELRRQAQQPEADTALSHSR
ncbi:MFS transporter, DHA1 family, inner membrane transport protein [Quadrisphaera granulorum]|uniref:DHA1 family inner membrane transport protein n=1 Tax=Quadrisphaera granulorum TaxID=317664 RepID=A0A315ZTV2_9ACTN|nr:MFS transporter [Quadrisphaera granulorum]PWJ48318.1 DHA1 family inner membrane transport protein [Quadrisphaera granulorum]SZE98479.1 MFS transporter, DHA1 family, inner membrane transport protein [Quadrisphaera granulorum]